MYEASFILAGELLDGGGGNVSVWGGYSPKPPPNLEPPLMVGVVNVKERRPKV